MPTPDRARYRNVVRAITATPWAILPETFDVIADVVSMRLAGGRLTAEEIEERIEAGPGSRAPYRTSGAVAVIPIRGVLMPRASLMGALSGATGLDQVAAAIDAAAADPEITAVVLDIDSPGGSTTMVPETAARIRAARDAKPVYAVASGMAASAAYWLASQADEVVASPSSMLGSIGVLAAHENQAGYDEKLGVEVTYVYAGKYKVEGHPHGPLDDEARGDLQGLVNEFYGMFVADVARGRDVSAATVRSDFGEGRVLTAKRAHSAGMADRIDTLDGTVARALRAPRKAAGARAELQQHLEAAPAAAEGAPPDLAVEEPAAMTEGDRALLARMHESLADATTCLKEA